MSKRYLILDCNYLIHRARYAFTDLSYAGSATGATYGFLKTLLVLIERFDTQNMIFCWDGKTNKRKRMLKGYKENRKKKEPTERDKIFEKDFYKQVRLLKTKYLQKIGFKNIFEQDGYEADDLIAAITKSLTPKKGKGIIVTADTDMYQLIREHISWYDPRKRQLISLGEFRRIFTMHPKDWIKVRCISGCRSDNIPGIHGVGPLTAISYVNKKLGKETKAYANIKLGWENVVKRNKPLIKLPLAGTITPNIVEDKISQSGWNSVTKSLGMKSIRWKRRRTKG